VATESASHTIFGLRYGSDELSISVPTERFQIITSQTESRTLSDVEIGEKLDAPIMSEALEDIIRVEDKVLLVVPDGTRSTGAGQIVNLIVRRLIANGTTPDKISILVANGIHRRMSDDELSALLTPFIVQRLNIFQHEARDLMSVAGLESAKIKGFGKTTGGLPIELNSRITECDKLIAVGGVTFHYFAGFTGGRKLICPGLASEKTIEATHKLAFDCETFGRRSGVGAGLLGGNLVHEAFIEAVSVRPPDFTVNSIVNEAGEIVDLVCGHWIAAHEEACSRYAASHTVTVEERRDLIIVSCGGFPHDINMIQAHKAIETAAAVCEDGGQIILLAECRDGFGRADFLKWFDYPSPQDLAQTLCSNYEVNGQTAWSLFEKTRRFNVSALCEMGESELRRVGITKLDHKGTISEIIRRANTGYVLPSGAKVRVVAR